MTPSTNASIPVLGNRSLNRALLERQLLLRRSPMSPLEATEHLIGLQAQAPTPPYYGLHSRLERFSQTDLSDLIRSRQATRIALMRSTIHLVSARDCLALRPLIQPVLERQYQGNYGRKMPGIDFAELAEAGRALVEERPLTFAELESALTGMAHWAEEDKHALSYAVRTYVPLVQVPPRGLWGESGQATHTSAEAWFGTALDRSRDEEWLVERYLAAYGPASINDFQTWSGLTRMSEVFRRMRPRLTIYKSEEGVELFDLADASLPGEDVPAPVRFIAEFDNLLLSHAQRSRIIAEEYRKKIFTINGIIRSSVLLNGFVAGMWKIERVKGSATLNIELFRPATGQEQDELALEGNRLLDFAAADCTERDIRISVQP
ncbi:winged helix DNA-binding domain-containing protein [Cohnella soli]|uniref:Winged helix DNA-binding domain-containing protein n=1 Tax=Cohnella soli TaxID=425005 RepID=A0ABW0HR28_9BACL